MRKSKSNVVLFLGGARSGKSALAEKIVSANRDVAYIATAKAIDEEMKERIRKHKRNRPSNWITFEVEGQLQNTLRQALGKIDTVIIDCLTIYVARRMEETANDDEIIDEIVHVVKEAGQTGKTVIIVSNEVGMGLVPDYPSGRRYRDLLGIVNQKVAEYADKVLLTIAGIPVDIKSLSSNFDGF
ncbi:MAG: bifunctional adenosylcobinamide kinase/adenosylcobinamide-phosphate guanylyltransferase [Firmicutes bacterium]|nr:bifunctional adenosylcobinamide kinase/adenosylcobinamide-phosphate guanylyltransferase [Bacillota bacterium]